ncbi:MAG TPA: hypothetical protein VHG91_03720, partial [Longimicrobium sp.]|nr:hypothetical protein [Longimicrobium sp.]
MADSAEGVPGGRRARVPRAAPAWAGGWGAVLALALWMQRLTPGWLAAAAAGALLWAALFRGARAWRWGAAAALLATVSIGAAVQFRLGAVARDWDVVRAGAEERAGAELKDALDDLFNRGFRAVDQAEAEVGGARGASAALFARLERIRAETRVAALALYLPDGSPLVWAGEHRGTVPDSIRAGLVPSAFYSGPLFGYVYFAEPLENGRVAVSAVLLDAHVAVGEGPEAFADVFAERYGVTPRFTTPDRAEGATVWDWSTEDRDILSVVFATITQERWRERVAGRGRLAAGIAWLLAALVLAGAWYRGAAGPPGPPVAVLTLALALLPLREMAGTEGVFSPLGFVLPLPLDVTLGQLLIVLAGASVWLLARPRAARPFAALPLAVRVPAAAGALVLALALVRDSAAPATLEARAAGGVPLVLALSLLAALPLLALLSQSDRVAERRWRKRTVALAVLLAGALAVGVLAWWRPGREVPLWTAALWALPFALAAAVLPRSQIGRGALLPWVVVGWLGATLALPQLWTMHLNARFGEASRELSRLGTQADPFLDFLLRQFAEKVLFFAAEGREGVPLLYQAWVDAGLAREGYEARVTLWDLDVASAELRLSETAIPPERVSEVLARARASEEPLVERFTDLDALHYLLAVALPGGRTVTVAVPPRSHLGRSTSLARFLDPAGQRAAEEGAAALSLVTAAGPAPPADSLRWERAERGWRSEAAVVFPSGPLHAHLVVPTPPTPILWARGVLAAVLALGVLTVLWALARTLCGEPLGLASGQWGWFWTFRGRLTLALFFFFLVPMAGFGAAAYRALSREVVRTAGALADRALGQAAAEVQGATLGELAQHVGADLLLYHRGVLAEAAAPEVIDLGLYHAWLPPHIYLGFALGERVAEQEERRLGGHEYLVAYRRLGVEDVLAAPTPLATGEIARRQRELADVGLLAIVAGAALSVVLSLLVGRALSRPI